jgi:hypothetical protein
MLAHVCDESSRSPPTREISGIVDEYRGPGVVACSSFLDGPSHVPMVFRREVQKHVEIILIDDCSESTIFIHQIELLYHRDDHDSDWYDPNAIH